MIGLHFHSDAQRGWQGHVLAEPASGVYLVELFSWLTGVGDVRRLVRLDDMFDWCFYESADEMNDAYEHGVQRRWDHERAETEAKPSRPTVPEMPSTL